VRAGQFRANSLVHLAFGTQLRRRKNLARRAQVRHRLLGDEEAFAHLLNQAPAAARLLLGKSLRHTDIHVAKVAEIVRPKVYHRRLQAQQPAADVQQVPSDTLQGLLEGVRGFSGRRQQQVDCAAPAEQDIRRGHVANADQLLRQRVRQHRHEERTPPQPPRDASSVCLRTRDAEDEGLDTPDIDAHKPRQRGTPAFRLLNRIQHSLLRELPQQRDKLVQSPVGQALRVQLHQARGDGGNHLGVVVQRHVGNGADWTPFPRRRRRYERPVLTDKRKQRMQVHRVERRQCVDLLYKVLPQLLIGSRLHAAIRRWKKRTQFLVQRFQRVVAVFSSLGAKLHAARHRHQRGFVAVETLARLALPFHRRQLVRHMQQLLLTSGGSIVVCTRQRRHPPGAFLAQIARQRTHEVLTHRGVLLAVVAPETLADLARVVQ
jgi:hypothetical protein